MWIKQENEIRSIARRWVERYHEEALDEARQRLAELREHGADEAYDLWLKIYEQARQLLASSQLRH